MLIFSRRALPAQPERTLLASKPAARAASTSAWHKHGRPPCTWNRPQATPHRPWPFGRLERRALLRDFRQSAPRPQGRSWRRSGAGAGARLRSGSRFSWRGCLRDVPHPCQSNSTRPHRHGIAFLRLERMTPRLRQAIRGSPCPNPLRQWLAFVNVVAVRNQPSGDFHFGDASPGLGTFISRIGTIVSLGCLVQVKGCHRQHLVKQGVVALLVNSWGTGSRACARAPSHIATVQGREGPCARS